MIINFFDLGLADYQNSLDFQKKTFNKVKSAEFKHALISCSHYPVITLGRHTKLDNLRVREEEVKSRGIKLIKVDRGGDITYHGPGQLTIYPIFNLTLLKKDIHLFIENLEVIAINTLKYFNIKGCQREGLSGVWVNNEKIASIGIAIRNWITYHGITLNIKKNDLENFSLIRPCGMDIMMTSCESILSKTVDIEDVNKTFKKEILKWPG